MTYNACTTTETPTTGGGGRHMFRHHIYFICTLQINNLSLLQIIAFNLSVHCYTTLLCPRSYLYLCIISYILSDPPSPSCPPRTREGQGVTCATVVQDSILGSSHVITVIFTFIAQTNGHPQGNTLIPEPQTHFLEI